MNRKFRRAIIKSHTQLQFNKAHSLMGLFIYMDKNQYFITLSESLVLPTCCQFKSIKIKLEMKKRIVTCNQMPYLAVITLLARHSQHHTSRTCQDSSGFKNLSIYANQDAQLTWLAQKYTNLSENFLSECIIFYRKKI